MEALGQLAKKIGISESRLVKILDQPEKFYKEYWTPKKDGTKRFVLSPNYELKGIQRWLCNNLFNGFQVNNSAHGFVRKRSIKTNAMMHIGLKYTLTVDLIDFFGTISAKMIKDEMMKEKYDESLVDIVVKLITYGSKLPQGSPASPVVSNIIFRSYDLKISYECQRLGVTYTRYADDLSFSSNDLDSLKFILSNFENLFLSGGPFQLNHKKTRILTGRGRKLVTGLLTNSKSVTVPKEYKNRLRGLLFRKIVKSDKDVRWRVINGLFYFVISIQPGEKEKIKKYIFQLKRKKEIFSM